jgi:uncharacterized protein YbjT (DUF2867 family)
MSGVSREQRPLVLLTGVSGYVGGRLLSALEKKKIPLRCLARRPEFVKARAARGTEVVAGDLLDPASLAAALTGVETAYYLVHSMGSSRNFEKIDRQAAQNFVTAARQAGVSRIIYLGGLGHGKDLSAHFLSRQEVGSILRKTGLPVLELRASIIIGSGSLSFEMIRALVERLPVMITPRWVRLKAQPIAIEDVLQYLVSALDLPDSAFGIYEIGGRDQVTYGDILEEYARQRGLRRLMIPVPFLTPRLSSLWLGLVTPIYARIGRRLFTSLRNSSVVEDERALKAFPIVPRGLSEAISHALRDEDGDYAATRWTDALSSAGAARTWAGSPGSRFEDSRSAWTAVSPSAAFKAFTRLGGRNGWYADPLWTLRGAMDLLLGGVGMRRGRPERRDLRPGDALDFWRVEAVEDGRLLRLYSEMKMPGRAWLQFEARPERDGCRIIQTALFEPLGLPGLLYWYALYPAHDLIFRGMLRDIVQRSEVH